MKIQEQTRPDLARLGESIDGIDVAMLATRSRTGDLESRPMTPIEMDAHGAFWFFTRRCACSHLRSRRRSDERARRRHAVAVDVGQARFELG